MIFLKGMVIATRGSNHAFKTPSNSLWKFLQECEAANPGYENLGKIYVKFPKPQATWSLATKACK